MIPFGNLFPFWSQLSSRQQMLLKSSCAERTLKKGTVIHNGSDDCVGLLLVLDGQLRVFTVSDEGREVTLYRLFELDICLFSASCIMSSIQFELLVEAWEDTRLLVIPSRVYHELMDTSLPVAKYTNELMASRFSDVMWLLDQVMNKSLDRRLAAFLTEEGALQASGELKLTHEDIARQLGSAREVITRMLKYFQSEGLVSLSRGTVKLLAADKLKKLAADSLR